MCGNATKKMPSFNYSIRKCGVAESACESANIVPLVQLSIPPPLHASHGRDSVLRLFNTATYNISYSNDKILVTQVYLR
jgi:hypothetical protein